MKNKLLLVGFLGLSLTALGQSSADQKHTTSSHEVKSPRDLATGQASGKRASQAGGVAAGDVNGDGATAVRESPSKASLGKTQVRAGEVDSDGKADQAAGHGPRQTTSQDGTFKMAPDTKAPRDLATGQASGKRQHEPVTITK